MKADKSYMEFKTFISPSIYICKSYGNQNSIFLKNKNCTCPPCLMNQNIHLAFQVKKQNSGILIKELIIVMSLNYARE